MNALQNAMEITKTFIRQNRKPLDTYVKTKSFEETKFNESIAFFQTYSQFILNATRSWYSNLMHGQPTNIMEACKAAIDQYYEDLKKSKQAEKGLCAALAFVNENYVPESQLYSDANALVNGREAAIYEAYKTLLKGDMSSPVYTQNYSPARLMLIICVDAILLNNGKLTNKTIIQEMKSHIDALATA